MKSIPREKILLIFFQGNLSKIVISIFEFKQKSRLLKQFPLSLSSSFSPPYLNFRPIYFYFFNMETVANILPSSLPILPLSNYVLLPSIVTSLSVCRSDMTQLLKNNPTGYIICVPLATKNKRGNNNKTASVTTDYSQLFYYGCVAKIIHQDDSLPNLSVIKVEGVCRSRIRDICSTDGASFEALLEHYPDNSLGDFLEEDKIVFRLLVNQFIQKMRLIGVSASVLNELHQLLDCCCSSYVANLVLCITDAPLTDKLNVLEVSDMKQKLNQVEHAVNTYLEVNSTWTGISIYA